MIDNWSRQNHKVAFYGLESDKKATFQLKANTKHEIFVVFCNILGPVDDKELSVLNTYIIFLFCGFLFFFWLTKINVSTTGALRLGGAEVHDSDKLLEEAVDLAKDADGVIAIVGLNDDWETEGKDRTTLALPGRTDELIERVAAVNPKTVVVIQAVCCCSCN